ncbi:hypothetical protein HK097_003639 [Rhizophlyctis rosea]|uniref:Hint domain-containing protein n=1 Tax=Rhizophlyctis rosea TaxID=64517 RepID=A0AAD5S3V7_9FUNG|nr:hypothetical protein HK097_003639 [Rhizophlyctis rosea]
MANIAGALCFPATASVTLENGSQKMMKDIQIGDRVKIGKDRYSEVFMWTHRLEHIITDFVKITHDHGELILTAGHYLYANGQILPANSVKIGDQIPLHDGSMSTIRSITTSIANGLYNPQTRDGDIAFNGVVTTTYTTVAHPVVAKGFLLVMQTIPSLARRLVGDRIASVNVIPSWASGIMGFLPAGTK